MSRSVLGAISNIFSRKAFIRRRGFEGDEMLARAMQWFVDTYAFSVVVETGTKRGDTAARLADIFDQVITIEKNLDLRPSIRATLGHYDTVRVWYGDSASTLQNMVLPQLVYPAVFYLDAHCGAEIDTLQAELSAMQGWEIVQESVLVIHDVVVPNSEFGDNGYTLQELVPYLQKINPNYETCYNHAATGFKRGVLFVGPAPIIQRFRREFQGGPL